MYVLIVVVQAGPLRAAAALLERRRWCNRSGVRFNRGSVSVRARRTGQYGENLRCAARLTRWTI
ncbi:MAG: hypothetical protein WB760_10645 [Xanthobacteraceae bacterium]